MTTPATPHDAPRHTHAMPRAQDTRRQATPQHGAERYALAAAGTVIIALTAGGFWLSYAHLAQVAGQHGLGSSPVRQWAWPATLDAFIVAGELLMLRAGLRRVTDWWAVALTAIGSAGSIALNVAGVSGTGNESVAPPLDYVVAAVPPTAALLAFGVLMRQVHQLVDRASDRPATIPSRRRNRLPCRPRTPDSRKPPHPATGTRCPGSRRAFREAAVRSAQRSRNWSRSGGSPRRRSASSHGASSNRPYGTRATRSAVRG